MSKPDYDPLEQVMKVVIEGFRHTTQAIQDLREQQEKLEQRQQEHARAAYDGMTGSGKSRYVSKLVEIERAIEEKGAQARVASTLDLSAGRISQLLNSEKNKKNGK
jgi:predicted XRE-type DNA-binding protein